jgi:hypothetical protein
LASARVHVPGITYELVSGSGFSSLAFAGTGVMAEIARRLAGSVLEGGGVSHSLRTPNGAQPDRAGASDRHEPSEPPRSGDESEAGREGERCPERARWGSAICSGGVQGLPGSDGRSLEELRSGDGLVDENEFDVDERDDQQSGVYNHMASWPTTKRANAIPAVGALSGGGTAESDMCDERSATARREWAMTRSIAPFGLRRRTGNREPVPFRLRSESGIANRSATSCGRLGSHIDCCVNPPHC